MTHSGGCHCGRIAFEVDGDLAQVMECNCGCAPFGVGSDNTGAAKAAVNVRCLDGVDLSALRVMQFDGRSL